MKLTVILSGAAAAQSAAATESKDPYSHNKSRKPSNVWSGHSCPLPLLLLLPLISIFFPTSAQAQDKPIALKGGKLLTITHGAIENGAILMQGGKITAVGPAGAVNIPSDAKIIDAPGMTIYPGLIDSETSLGLTEISAE